MTAPASARRRRIRRLAVVGAVLVPLAFSGLFIAALASGEDALDRIPAAIVNNDELVQQTLPDGTEQPVLAGRQLVTELTDPGTTGFDWQLTNDEDAEKALAAGEVYAVLTVPEDFSASITSLQSPNPQQAQISLRADDAHAYLTGAVAQAVGDGMVRAFGTEITKQYISGVYASVGQLGSALTQAADGAAGLQSGAASAQQGAVELGDGLRQYTDGVDQLSGGLDRLRSGTSNLPQLSTGVAQYTSGVSQLSAALSQAVAAQQADPLNPQWPATIAGISQQLATAAASGGQLSNQTASALNGVRSGIAQSADGARELAAGGDPLVSGAESLAGGLGELGSGAQQLAEGLRSGAAQVPASDTDTAEASADVASDPVSLEVTRDHEVSDAGRIVATLAVPLALWLGAFATALVLGRPSPRLLTSTVGTGRLLGAALGRAAAAALVQAGLLVVLLHTMAGVGWEKLPATLGFVALTALSFTAFHVLLTLAFGRTGLVISLLLLALQLTATSGLYPVEVLAPPFPALNPLLPLPQAVDGLQAILAGGAASPVIAACVALVCLGLVSVLLGAVALRRVRRVQATRLIPAFGG